MSGVYYLMLGMWFGALVMLVVAAVATFGTIRDSQPDMTAAAQNQLAGSIVGSAIDKLAVVQVVAAVAITVCVLLQCTVFRRELGPKVFNAARIVLLVLLLAVLGADRLFVAPALHTQRETMHSAAGVEQEQAKAAFDRTHKMSERLAGVCMLLIVAATLTSPFALCRKDDA